MEIIILTQARFKAAGITGGLLLLLAAQPGYAQRQLPARPVHACDADARSRAACQEVKEAIDDPERIAAGARHKHPKSRLQHECRYLKAAIRDNEQLEQRSSARGLIESLGQDTLSLRQRYRQLRC